MQPRQIARELAALSLSQLPSNTEKLATQQLSSMILAVVRTLTSEVQESLEAASAELKRSSDRLLTSETRASDVQSARAMLQDAVDITQAAINKIGTSLSMPEFIFLSNQQEVRAYALEILTNITRRRNEIDQLLTEALEDWQLSRLPRIDQDILRVAVVEIEYLGVPQRVAINEAVELAKRYSDEEGYRFINGVLRRVSDKIKAKAEQS